MALFFFFFYIWSQASSTRCQMCRELYYHVCPAAMLLNDFQLSYLEKRELLAGLTAAERTVRQPPHTFKHTQWIKHLLDVMATELSVVKEREKEHVIRRWRSYWNNSDICLLSLSDANLMMWCFTSPKICIVHIVCVLCGISQLLSFEKNWKNM